MSFSSKLKNEAFDLVSQTANLNLPNALLIIPDGNGRWAKNLGLSISEGHRAGGKTMSQILDHFMKTNIKFLGIWGFSEDNWKRDKDEIDKIMDVISTYIKDNLEKMITKKIKFIVLGKRDKIQTLYPELIKVIENAEEKTSENSEKILGLFLDYGERFQLEEFAKARLTDNSSSTYELLQKINKGIPLFDMVLRTSGEHRLSGFGPLASLAEFVSVNKNLPDLDDKEILLALKEFSGRQRRLGGR